MTEGPDRPEPELSFRDQRAVREVDRSVGALAGFVFVLTALALELPVPWVGVAALVALSAAGAVYIGWADRLVSEYEGDLLIERTQASGSGPLGPPENPLSPRPGPTPSLPAVMPPSGRLRSAVGVGDETDAVPGTRVGSDQL